MIKHKTIKYFIVVWHHSFIWLSLTLSVAANTLSTFLARDPDISYTPRGIVGVRYILIYCCSCIFRKRVFLLLRCTFVPVVNFWEFYHKTRHGFCSNCVIVLSFARLRIEMIVDGGIWLRYVYLTCASRIVNLKGWIYSEIVLLLTHVL